MVLKRKLSALLTVALLFALSGCAVSPNARMKGATGDNAYLDKVASPGCLTRGSVNNTLAPPVLYQGMVSCVKANNLNDGVLLFALAGAYSYFDALRVDTDTARKAHSSMLGEALKSVSPDQQQAFWRAINQRLGNRQHLSLLCRQVEDIGRPIYSPAYVLKAGDGGASGPGNPAMWNEALKGYLHCATDVLSIK